MKRISTVTKVIFCVFIMAGCIDISNNAQKRQDKLVWAEPAVARYAVHDPNRPKPPVIIPPEQPGQPPSNAIILFDGKNLSEWVSDKGDDAKWKLENGYMEVNKTGGIHTKKSFGNCQLHIE